jgi:hypothetical protein
MSSLQSDKLFGGSIPKLYEDYLVPMIFEPYAEYLRRPQGRSPNKFCKEPMGPVSIDPNHLNSRSDLAIFVCESSH